MEVDLSKVIGMAKKAGVWRQQSKGDKNGQNNQKAGGTRSGKQGQKGFKTNEKVGLGKKGSRNAV